MTDVTRWLEALGLEQYAQAFEENAIDADVLPDLTEHDLEKIGVKLGHRKKLLRAIASAGAEAAAPDLSSGPEPARESQRPPQGLAPWQRNPGERKSVTLLFVDVAGSTALTEHLDPEDAHELLYGATRRMCEAVESSRGTVCRFMGDGLMAVFGAPMASEQHAVDACEAAMEMQRAVREYSRKLNVELQIRVGLHSGEVVVLTVGDGDKVEYDASGPTVPIAARLEQVAVPGAVYLTAATRDLCAGRIEAEALEPVSVKGVSEPLPVFALRRVRSVEEARRQRAHTPFVGRQATLRQLWGLLESCAEDGQGQTVFIRGEPGIGKTRLVEELARNARDAGVACHRALVLPFGVGTGQDAIRSLVRSLLGLGWGSVAATAPAASQAIDRGWIDSNQAVFLNELLDLPQPKALQGLYDAMDNRTRNEGRQATVSSLVSGVSRRELVLVVVEDVHWADARTLSHLSDLARTVCDCPVLLVMTSRIEGDPLDRQWKISTQGSPFVAVELGPLRKEESIALIGAFMDASDQLAADCLERAAGNPLFLEQLLRNAREGVGQGLPDSIQSLVLARMDRLTPLSKRVLQTAAVIGQRFAPDPLSYLLEATEVDFGELIEHNLIQPEGDGYLFSHALIQEGAYSSMLMRQRRELHRRAAEWFEAADPVLHAEHLEHAEDPGAAQAYLAAARDEAVNYRYDVSLELVDRGLVLAAGQTLRHELGCHRGQVLQDLGDIRASVDAYEETLAHTTHEVQQADAWMGLAAGMRVLTEYEAALEYLGKVEPIAVQYDLKLHLTRMHHLRGNLYFSLGRGEECFEQHRHALDHARGAGSVEAEVQALGGLADAEYARGNMSSSCEYFGRCLDECARHGFGRAEVANRAQMSIALAYCGDYRGGLDAGLAAIEGARTVGHRRAEMNGHCCASLVLLDMGEWERALEAADRCLVLVDELGARGLEPLVLACRALSLVGTGDRGHAMDALRRAQTIQAAAASAGFTGGHVYGATLLAAEDPASRERAFRLGLELLERPCIAHVPMRLHRYRIEACLQTGDWSGARSAARALEAFSRDGERGWVDYFVRWGHALSAWGEGQTQGDARAALERLVDEARAVGLGSALPALQQALTRTDCDNRGTALRTLASREGE